MQDNDSVSRNVLFPNRETQRSFEFWPLCSAAVLRIQYLGRWNMAVAETLIQHEHSAPPNIDRRETILPQQPFSFPPPRTCREQRRRWHSPIENCRFLSPAQHAPRKNNNSRFLPGAKYRAFQQKNIEALFFPNMCPRPFSFLFCLRIRRFLPPQCAAHLQYNQFLFFLPPSLLIFSHLAAHTISHTTGKLNGQRVCKGERRSFVTCVASLLAAPFLPLPLFSVSHGKSRCADDADVVLGVAAAVHLGNSRRRRHIIPQMFGTREGGAGGADRRWKIQPPLRSNNTRPTPPPILVRPHPLSPAC